MAIGNNAGPGDDYTKLVPIIWTAIRLLGVYITIVGASVIAEDLATMATALAMDGQSADFLLDRTRPKVFGDAVYLASGLYLIFGGQWLFKNVFLPASDATGDSDSDEGATS